MAAVRIENGLITRLERLAGDDASCCVPEYQELAKRILQNARFATSLARAEALADSSRLLTVAMLSRRKELCACEIQAALGVTHATVSHHMQVLLAAGLVSAERRGKWMYYSLRSNPEVKVP